MIAISCWSGVRGQGGAATCRGWTRLLPPEATRTADGKREPSEGGGGRPGLSPNRHYLGHFSQSPRLFHSETFLGWLVCFHLDGIVGAGGHRDNGGRWDLCWRQDGHPPLGLT